MNMYLYGLIIEQARKRQTIHYEDTYKPGRTNRRMVGPQLDEINRHEVGEKRPLLSVLVVSATNGLPSKGFWACAEALDRYSPDQGRRAFARQETDLVLATWAP
jgi:hypothetical protein